MDNLTTALAALTALIPRSISDQATKMFVKRLLKRLFDGAEDAVVKLSWLALTSLFQALWLLVFQLLAKRAATTAPATLALSRTASTAAADDEDDANTSTEALAGWSTASTGVTAPCTFDGESLVPPPPPPPRSLPEVVVVTSPAGDGSRDSSPDSATGVRNNALAYVERLRRGAENEETKTLFADLRAWAERRQRARARDEDEAVGVAAGSGDGGGQGGDACES